MKSNSLLYALNDVDPKIIRSAEPGRRKIRTSVYGIVSVVILFAAAALAVVSLGRGDDVTAAHVYLDVNPSFVLGVSEHGKILEVFAENDDAKKVLSENKELEDEKHVTISKLLDGIMKSGYLSAENDTILLSVDCEDDRLAEKLRSALADETGRFMNSKLPTGRAITQSLTENEQADSIADNYGISIGKAAFLIRLIGLKDDLTAEKLASLGVSELRQLCEENNISTERRVMLTQAEAYEKACAVLRETAGTDTVGGTVYGYVEVDTYGFWRIVVQGEKTVACCDIDGETGDVIREKHSPILDREQALDAAIVGAGFSSEDVLHYDLLKTEEWIWRYVAQPALNDKQTRTFLNNEIDLTDVTAYKVTIHTVDSRFYSVKVNGITGETVEVSQSNYSYRIDTLDAVIIAMEDAGIEFEIPDPSNIRCIISNGLCDLEFEFGSFRYTYQIDAYTGEVLAKNAANIAP